MPGWFASLTRSGIALAALCALPHAQAQGRNPLICEPVPGVGTLLDRYERVILVADRPGTRELPATLGEIACALSARDPLVVGVEWLTDLQPWIDAFMASDGGEEARTALVNILDPAYGAGSPTYAAIDMLERLRGLSHAGRDVRVLAWLIPELEEMPPPVEPIPTEGDNAFEIYDPDEDLSVPPPARAVTSNDLWRNGMREPESLEEAREAFMADMIQAVSAPDARFLLLANPDRARKAPAKAPSGVEHPSFAMTFPPGSVYSLDVGHERGEAWTCTAEGCRIRPISASGRGDGRLVAQFPVRRDGLDGLVHLGPVSASPPAQPPPPQIAFELYFDVMGEDADSDEAETSEPADTALLIEAGGP